MMDVGQGVTKDRRTIHIYLIHAVHTRLCRARSGSPQLIHVTLAVTNLLNIYTQIIYMYTVDRDIFTGKYFTCKLIFLHNYSLKI